MISKTITKPSVSYSQSQLKAIGDMLCDDIENLLEVLHIDDYRLTNKMVICKCPIHNGDNESACNIYHEGETYRGNWKCRTHSCESIFRSSILGFIRGVLSHKKFGWEKQGDKTCSFNEAVKFALDFLNKDVSLIETSSNEIDNFKYVAKTFTTNLSDNKQHITRDLVINTLDIPAKYYIDRNYKHETLIKYDVGLCTNPNKPMYNRVVVPIYCNQHKFVIGCTGRSIFEKCNKCGAYHNPNTICPSTDKKWIYSKWKHSSSFKSQECLYNMWFAKEYIKSSRSIIIVESPGNVWRLEEAGIHNSVAIFGSSISDTQKILIDSSGAMDIIVLTDNDEAGDKAYKQIMDKFRDAYRVHRPKFDASDIGEMTTEEIYEQLLPQLKEFV